MTLSVTKASLKRVFWSVFWLFVLLLSIVDCKEYSCGHPQRNQYNNLSPLSNNFNNNNNNINKYRPIEIRKPRIIGGDETNPGEFPWTASIKLNGQPICGGSLIDESWILTAAHCVVGYNPKNLTVRLGSYRIKDLSEPESVELPVNMFIIHKDYSVPRPFSNDIALLKLTDFVRYTDFILPVCLPFEDQIGGQSFQTGSLGSNGGSPIGDYNSIHLMDYPMDNPLSDQAEASGIVISTKMSDLDITRCFNRLEQNYLNSIGLAATTSTERPSTSEPRPMPLRKRPSNRDYQNHNNNANEVSYHDLFNSILMPIEGADNNKITLFSSPNSLSTTTTSQQHTTNQQFELHNNHNQDHEQESYIARKREDIHKLSRIPINEELIKEIHEAAASSDIENDIGSSIGSSSSSSGSSINNHHVHDDPTLYAGLNGIVVGWGWIKEADPNDLDPASSTNSKGFPSVTLQKVRLPILRNKACEAWFQSQSKKITLLPSQFCAGFQSGGKDACRVSRERQYKNPIDWLCLTLTLTIIIFNGSKLSKSCCFEFTSPRMLRFRDDDANRASM